MAGRFDDAYFDKLTQAIEHAETLTSAEVVVVVHPDSGTYRDVHYLVGAVLGWAGLVFAIFNPWTVHSEDIIALEAIAMFFVGLFLSMACWPIKRLLTTRKRRESQVLNAARATFVEHGVVNTRARTGVLIYFSRFERCLEVLADIGILKNAKPETWNACLFKLQTVGLADDPTQALLDGIKLLGETLAEPLPPGDDNPDELPNRPRTRS